MASPAKPADRHEPLPGLFALPGHLLGKQIGRAHV